MTLGRKEETTQLEAQVAALSETFESMGWDLEVLGMFARWAERPKVEFSCTPKTFTLEIASSEGKTGVVLRELVRDSNNKKMPLSTRAVSVIREDNWRGDNWRFESGKVDFINAIPRSEDTFGLEALVIVVGRIGVTVREDGQVKFFNFE